MALYECTNCKINKAIFRCTACRNANYCCKECQIADWLRHKKECDFENRLVKIVVVDGKNAKDEKIHLSELSQNNSWKECELPKILGLPVMVKRWRENKSNENSPDRAIFLMIDPKTGEAGEEWQLGCGVVAFAKTDRTDFNIDLFWDLYFYINYLMEFYSKSNFNYENFEKIYLNPAAFKTYQENQHRILAETQRQHFLFE